ncbi:6775_t:CDS:2, partial [Funneliformis mosseae]
TATGDSTKHTVYLSVGQKSKIQTKQLVNKFILTFTSKELSIENNSQTKIAFRTNFYARHSSHRRNNTSATLWYTHE